MPPTAATSRNDNVEVKETDVTTARTRTMQHPVVAALAAIILGP
jgi:hypothetical protein